MARGYAGQIVNKEWRERGEGARQDSGRGGGAVGTSCARGRSAGSPPPPPPPPPPPLLGESDCGCQSTPTESRWAHSQTAGTPTPPYPTHSSGRPVPVWPIAVMNVAHTALARVALSLLPVRSVSTRPLTLAGVGPRLPHPGRDPESLHRLHPSACLPGYLTGSLPVWILTEAGRPDWTAVPLRRRRRRRAD